MEKEQQKEKESKKEIKPADFDLGTISEIARASLKHLVANSMPAIPPLYEKIFYNIANTKGETELVNRLMATLPTGQAASLLVEGVSSMITSLTTDMRRYRLGLDQHGGQMDAQCQNIKALVEPKVWKILKKDLNDLRTANEMMKSQLTAAEGRLESQEEQVSQLKRKSRSDPLTGVMNRLAMEEDLPDEFARAKRYKRVFTLVMADIDFFKKINDNYGHNIGDEALKSFAVILMKCVRDVDVIYRFGGEEFLLLLPETDTKGAIIATERIRERIESHVLTNKSISSLKLTASFGLSSFREGDTKYLDILKRADKALYRAKEKGRNRVESIT